MATGLDIAVGVIGVVGVAQQLTQSILKLKDFCKAVKDAPDELRDLIDSIENTGRILVRLSETSGAELACLANDDIFQASIDLCKKAVDRIANLAVQLHRELNSKKYHGAIRFVLKKREVKSMITKLDQSKTDLILAHSMYESAMRRRDYETIRKFLEEQREGRAQYVEYTRTTALHREVPDVDADTTTLTRTLRNQAGPGKRKSHQTIRIQFRFPLWLCQNAWDAAFDRASGRWTFTLQTYKILPYHAEIWKLCQEDDVGRITDMLETRQLCIHDQDESGRTMFHVAIDYGSFQLCQYLLSHGAVLPSPDDFDNDDFEMGLSYHQGIGEITTQGSEFAQFLLENCEWDEASDAQIAAIKAWSTPPACRTSEQQFLVFSQYALEGYSVQALNYAELCQIDAPFLRLQDRYGDNFLHTIGRQWALYLSHRLSERGTTIADGDNRFSTLVTRAIAASDDLHLMNYSGNTSLLSFIAHLSLITRVRGATDLALQRWIQCLAHAGVDLPLYGRMEQKLMRDTAGRHFQSWAAAFSGRCRIRFGRKPSHWGVYWAHPGDVFSSMFWTMIEHPQEMMPGAWIEDDQDEDEADLFYDLWAWRRRNRYKLVKRRVLRRMKAEVKAARHDEREAAYDSHQVDILCAKIGKLEEIYKEGVVPELVGHGFIRTQHMYRHMKGEMAYERMDWLCQG